MDSQQISLAQKRLLAIILVGFAALSLIYSLVTQLKFGPDEPAHFIYVRSLATTLSPPPISHTQTHTADSTASHEGHQPPLYYALMAVPFAIMHAFGVASDTIWRVLRVLGIPIGVVWIFFVYKLARVYFENVGYALATTAFVALIPNAAYCAGVVNNDVLIALLFTWALVYILKYFKTEQLPNREAMALGVVIGLAALTKAQGLILVPVLLIAALAVLRRHGYSNLPQVLRTVAIALGVSALVSGWWFARCWMLYGTLMPYSLHDPMVPALIDLTFDPAVSAKVIVLSSVNLCIYFWTPFWLVWKFIPWPCYFGTLCGWTLVALIGLARRAKPEVTDWRSLGLLLFTAFLMWALWMRYVILVDRLANLQGRLLLPVAAVAGIVCILGYDGWLPTPKAKRAGVIAGVALMLIANAVVIACDIAFYAAGGL